MTLRAELIEAMQRQRFGYDETKLEFDAEEATEFVDTIILPVVMRAIFGPDVRVQYRADALLTAPDPLDAPEAGP